VSRAVAALSSLLVATLAHATAVVPVADGGLRELGPGWVRSGDPATGRPRRLAGGAIRWLDPAEASETSSDDRLVDLARAFLEENSALLGLDGQRWDPVETPLVRSVGGYLATIHFGQLVGEVPVLGARATLVVSRGSLVYAHVVGGALGEPSTAAQVDRATAVDVAFRAAGASHGAFQRDPTARLVLADEGSGHVLAWRVELVSDDPPQRLVARVDAQSGQVLGLSDETVQACANLPAAPLRPAVGGVRLRRADDPEVRELLQASLEGAGVASSDGFLPAAHEQGFAALLTGPWASVSCQGCAHEVPRAGISADGSFDFGTGGQDAVGNGMSTPADRTSYFHAHRLRRLALRWLDLPWLAAPLLMRTNAPFSCNAYWNGRSITFARSSAACLNTGEIADIVAHEWGHGLDDNDGLPSASLTVDAATGEAVGDITALLATGDSCVGESFRTSEGPSQDCDGVRDLDEHAPGGRGTLTPAIAVSTCPPSGSYRGPLGREGHCEGEILGQAAWHLVSCLRTGVSGIDGRPLPDAPLDEGASLDVLGRIHFGSRAIMASYAPSTLQSLGPSAHDAWLLADDEGDGLANGTPHAAAIEDALRHHGLLEPGPATADAPGAGSAITPAITVSPMWADGVPVHEIAWSAAGASRAWLLRSDAPDEPSVVLEELDAASGAGTVRDRCLVPARRRAYRLVAVDAAGAVVESAPVVAAFDLSSVGAVDLALDDASRGDGDGVLSPGEDADAEITLRNVGASTATAVVVECVSSSAAVAIVEPPSVVVGDLAPGATARAVFHVRAGLGAPQESVELDVRVESADGCMRSARGLRVADAIVGLAGISETVTLGDGDDRWEAGEDVSIAPLLSNAGLRSAGALNGTVALVPDAPAGVSLVSRTLSWDGLAAGAVAAAPAAGDVVLRADAAVASREAIELELTLDEGGRRLASLPFEVVLNPLPPPLFEMEIEGYGHDILVGQLTDDDGDGLTTRCDVPDIVTTSGGVDNWCVLRVHSGDDGRLLWTHDQEDAPCRAFTRIDEGMIAIADVDGDGFNELLAADRWGYACALGTERGLVWRSAQQLLPSPADHGLRLEPWDLDGDGIAEVVAGGVVLDGRDGSVKWRISDAGNFLVGDVDLDGGLEVLLGDPMGTVDARGEPTTPTFSGVGDHALLADVDDDPFPELVTAVGALRIADHDGTRLEGVDVPLSSWMRDPCTGDLDGDGRDEVIVVDHPSPDLRLAAHGADGTLRWRSDAFAVGTDAFADYADCVVTDLDGRGGPEVVAFLLNDLVILDGRTGRTLHSQRVAETRLMYGGLSVADVDADGSAEILLSGFYPHPRREPLLDWDDRRVFVFGNPDWAPAGAWTQGRHVGTNVDADGRVVPHPFPHWLASDGVPVVAPLPPCGSLEAGIDVSVPACTGDTRGRPPGVACLSGWAAGAVEPVLWRWELPDGSTSEARETCHDFGGPGSHPVLLTVEDALGSTAVAWRSVVLHEGLLASVPDVVACVGEPACLVADVSGGVTPLELTWTVDGAAVGDAPPCLDLAQGSHVARCLVRDANGCEVVAEARVTVAVAADLPEVSRPGSSQPLLVAKEAGALRLRWAPAGRTCEIQEGSLEDLLGLTPSHEAVACAIAAPESSLAATPGNRYLLVAASGCPGEGHSGPVGRDSFGRPRPTAADLGRPTCP
jgi:hypothetical protein